MQTIVKRRSSTVNGVKKTKTVTRTGGKLNITRSTSRTNSSGSHRTTTTRTNKGLKITRTVRSANGGYSRRTAWNGSSGKSKTNNTFSSGSSGRSRSYNTQSNKAFGSKVRHVSLSGKKGNVSGIVLMALIIWFFTADITINWSYVGLFVGAILASTYIMSKASNIITFLLMSLVFTAGLGFFAFSLI